MQFYAVNRTGNKNFARLCAALLLVVCASCVVAACSGQLFRAAPQAKRNAPETEKLEDQLKWLGSVVEGNSAEVGKRSARYDSYQYDGYRFAGCSVSWRELHEAALAGEFISKEFELLQIPLGSLDKAGVRVDKLDGGAYVVSFTTVGLKADMITHVRSTYEDGSQQESDSRATGRGIYFQNEDVARRVARVLVLGIKSCQTGNPAAD